MRKTTIFAVGTALLLVLPALGGGDPKSCPWDLDDSGSVGTSDLLELFETGAKMMMVMRLQISMVTEQSAQVTY